MPNEIHTYTTLRKQMHDALKAEHPEWVDPDGESPILDLYDARFAELLTLARSPAGEEAQGASSSFSRTD